MDNFTKIKNDFDTSAKAIAEKEKMYMDNARRAGPRKKAKETQQPEVRMETVTEEMLKANLIPTSGKRLIKPI